MKAKLERLSLWQLWIVERVVDAFLFWQWLPDQFQDNTPAGGAQP